MSVENKCLFDRLFVEYRDGFYVFAKRCVSKPRLIVGYVGRYLCHPVIAESRFSEFNVETNMFAFWFVDEYKVKWFVTLPALEFI